MIWLLALYGLAVVAIGLLDARKAGTFDSFVLAGRHRSTMLVTASMLASVVGASATVGVVDLARRVGAPAFWWLGSGALGLVLAGLLIARRLREGGYSTLSDMVGVHFGRPTQRLTALIVVVGWTGITAAQFVAAAAVVSSLSGWSYGLSLLLAGGFITVYCTLGGQASVLKTDLLQLAVMLAGLGLVLWRLYSRRMPTAEQWDLRLINDSFPALSFWHFMIVVGSGFIVGPDVFSRLFTARSGRSAAVSAVASGVLLAVVSAGITAIGLWARQFAEVPEGQRTLNYLLTEVIGGPLGALLSLGLLSAIISSADTCMISASTNCEHDLLGGSSIVRVRVITALLGAAAMAVAAWKSDIIGTLVLAYSLFNCGVIPPVITVLLVRSDRRMNRPLTASAIVLGGALGVSGSLGLGGEAISGKALSLCGMGVSALLSAAALLIGSRSGQGSSASAA